MQAQLKQSPPSRNRCLIIEDTFLDQKMIKRAIASAHVDADVEIADTLDAARRALATGPYSVILCDNNLPDGNGTDFAQQLASDPGYRNTSIVIVSGWPSPFMWAKAKAAGLQIIDKNDDPHVKLRAILKCKLGYGIASKNNTDPSFKGKYLQ